MSNRKLRHGKDEAGSSELLDAATLQEIVTAAVDLDTKQAAKSPDAGTDNIDDAKHADGRHDRKANATRTQSPCARARRSSEISEEFLTKERPRGTRRARRSSDLSEELLQDIVRAREQCNGEKEVENAKNDSLRRANTVTGLVKSSWHSSISRPRALKRENSAPGAFKVSCSSSHPVPAGLAHLSAKHGLEFESASSQALSAFLVNDEADTAAPSSIVENTPDDCAFDKGSSTHAGSSGSHASSGDSQQDGEQQQMVLPEAAVVKPTASSDDLPQQDEERPDMLIPALVPSAYFVKPMVDDDDDNSITSVTSFCSTNGWSSFRQIITGILPGGGSQKQQSKREILSTQADHEDEEQPPTSTLTTGAEVKSSSEDDNSIEIGGDWRTLVCIGLMIAIVLIPLLLVLSLKDR